MTSRSDPQGAMAPDRWRRVVPACFIALAVVAVALWLWRCVCLFPAHGWNEVRLAPAFQWMQTGTPYPDPAIGPTTTWIYGPIPLLLAAPATLASDAVGALLTAAVVNATFTLFVLGAVCWWWPLPGDRPEPLRRAIAALLCIALWPSASFRYFQADNAALAFGLLSLVLLVRARGARNQYLAAATCVAAILCKQSLLGLALAQITWLWIRDGWPAARVYGFRLALCLAPGLAAASALWGASNVGYHLIALPARLPWAESFGKQALKFWPDLLGQAALPAIGLGLLGRSLWHRNSPWLLPALAWLLSWPLDLAALLKVGGAGNSLHGALLLLPVAATLLAHRAPLAVTTRLFPAIALLVTGLRLLLVAPETWTPRIQHLREGEALARQLPGEIFFPWHPLITFYADGRFDEVEDGLFIRVLAGQPVARTRVHLPPRFHVLAFRRDEADWGIARSLLPARATEAEFGRWTIYSWPEETRAAPK